MEKQRKSRYSFLINWQTNCNHAYYRIQRRSFNICATEEFRCCLCDYRLEALEAISPKDRVLYCHTSQTHRETILDEKGPSCIGTHFETFLSPLPIPPEHQAEVDEKERQLTQIDNEIARLEEKLCALSKVVGPLEKELKDIAYLLKCSLNYPETVSAPHRWGRDDFNYDPFD